MSDTTEKTVRIADLKARLSAWLRIARRGDTITVYDRNTPVARIVPYRADNERLRTRAPIRAPSEVHLPGPLDRPIDSLSALLEERQSDR